MAIYTPVALSTQTYVKLQNPIFNIINFPSFMFKHSIFVLPITFLSQPVHRYKYIPNRFKLQFQWKHVKATSLASPQAFRTNPSLVWEFYHYRRCAVEKCEPNAGHFALAELEKSLTQEPIVKNLQFSYIFRVYGKGFSIRRSFYKI